MVWFVMRATFAPWRRESSERWIPRGGSPRRPGSRVGRRALSSRVMIGSANSSESHRTYQDVGLEADDEDDRPGPHESDVRSLAATLKRRRQKAAILPLNAGRLPHSVRYPVARQPPVPEASGGGIHIRRCGRAPSIGMRPTRTTHARRVDETSYSTGLVGISAQLKQALVPIG